MTRGLRFTSRTLLGTKAKIGRSTGDRAVPKALWTTLAFGAASGVGMADLTRAASGIRRREHQKCPNSTLIPLVFLILPVTILFAIFPATLVLQLGF
jgi:hypothetical protein